MEIAHKVQFYHQISSQLFIVTQEQAENCLSCYNSKFDLWPHASFMLINMILYFDSDFI